MPQHDAAAMKRRELKKRLWRLSFAHAAFTEALNSATLYSEMKIADEHPMHYTFVSSIAATYCRPFITAKVMGKLPQVFTRFADTNLQQTHNVLIGLRNSWFAHADPLLHKQSFEVHLDTAATPTRLQFTHSIEPINSKVQLHLKALCDHQHKASREAMTETLLSLHPPEELGRILRAEGSTSTTFQIFWPKD